jgi:hypothetical protein
MTLTLTNEGDLVLLKAMVNYAAPTNPVAHLFNTNVSPAKTDTVGSFVQVSATGYTAVGLTGASWSCVTNGNTTAATYPAVTFSISASTPVYGYYITNADSSKTLWAESFGVVENIPSGGGSIILTPCITLN